MTATLSPARQALAAAHRRRDEAVDRQAKIRAARGRSWSLVGDARDAADEAQRNLATARRAETTAVLSSLLGDDTKPSPSVADAEAALAAARSRLAAAEHAAEALIGQDEAANRALDAANRGVREAIGAVIAEAGLIETLLTRFEAALDLSTDLRSILHIMPGRSQRQMDRSAITIRNGTERGRAEFEACLTALETDPAAALPNVDALDAGPERHAAREAA